MRQTQVAEEVAQPRSCPPTASRAPSPSPSETTTATNTTALTIQSSSLILTPPPIANVLSTPPSEPAVGIQSPSSDVDPSKSPEAGTDTAYVKDESPDTVVADPISMSDTAEGEGEGDTGGHTPPVDTWNKTSVGGRIDTTKKPKSPQAEPPGSQMAASDSKKAPLSTKAVPGTITPSTKADKQTSSSSASSPRHPSTVMLSKGPSSSNTPRAVSDHSLMSSKAKRTVSSQGSSGGVVLGIAPGPSASSSHTSVSSSYTGTNATSSAGSSSRPASTSAGGRGASLAPRHLRRHQEQPGQPRAQPTVGSPVNGRNTANFAGLSPQPGAMGMMSPVGVPAPPFFPRPISWNGMYSGGPQQPQQHQQQPNYGYGPVHGGGSGAVPTPFSPGPMSPPPGFAQPMMMFPPPPHGPHSPVPMYPGMNGMMPFMVPPGSDLEGTQQNGVAAAAAAATEGDDSTPREVESSEESADDEEEDDVILVSVDDMAIDFPTLNPSAPKSRRSSAMYEGKETKAGLETREKRGEEVGAAGTAAEGDAKVSFSRGTNVMSPMLSCLPNSPQHHTQSSMAQRFDAAVADAYLRSESRSSASSSSEASSMALSTKPSSLTPHTGSSANPSPRMGLKHLHPLSVPPQPPSQPQQYFTPSHSPYMAAGPPGYSPLQPPQPHYMRSTSTPSPIPMMPGWYNLNANNQSPSHPYPYPVWGVPQPYQQQQHQPQQEGEASVSNSPRVTPLSGGPAGGQAYLNPNGGSSAPRSRSSSPFVLGPGHPMSPPPPGPPPPPPMGYAQGHHAPVPGYPFPYPPPPGFGYGPPPFPSHQMMMVPGGMVMTGDANLPPLPPQQQQQQRMPSTSHRGSIVASSAVSGKGFSETAEAEKPLESATEIGRARETREEDHHNRSQVAADATAAGS